MQSYAVIAVSRCCYCRDSGRLCVTTVTYAEARLSGAGTVRHNMSKPNHTLCVKPALILQLGIALAALTMTSIAATGPVAIQPDSSAAKVVRDHPQNKYEWNTTVSLGQLYDSSSLTGMTGRAVFNIGQQEDSAAVSHTETTGTSSSPLHQQHRTIVDGLECPSWLYEYQTFHQRNRGAPDAKYLVYTTRKYTSGLGDRFRVMISALRLAYATSRVLLATWNNEPVEPQQFLPPAGFIDWTLSGIPYNPEQAKKYSYWTFQDNKQQRQEFENMLMGGLHNETAQFVSISTSKDINTRCLGCPQVRKPGTALDKGGEESVCAFNFLFQPSAELSKLADQQMVDLYGPQALEPGFKYVAAHMRLGGLPTEPKTLHRGTGKGQLHDFITVLQQAGQLADESGIDRAKVPTLLLTDRADVRKAILVGYLAGVTTTKTMPVHVAHTNKLTTDEGRKQHLKGVESAFLDIVLLARAHCLIAGKSGFSDAAWMMSKGYAGCFTYIHKTEQVA